jgi:hypothetical protein
VDDLWEPNDREPTEPDEHDEPVRTGPVTAADIAEHLTGSDNDYTEALDGWPSLHAVGDVLHIKFTPAKPSDVDDNAIGQDTKNIRHFRAVVVEGEQPPIVLPAGAGCDYINGDDGYHWLTCGTCEQSLVLVEAGTSVAAMVGAIAAHQCAQSQDDPSDGEDVDGGDYYDPHAT